MKEEGYIKFNCEWIEEELSKEALIEELNIWRNRLYDQELIGAYADGIGYGNISLRTTNNNFIITGSATGNLPYLTNKHYTNVTDYDIVNNHITCKGPIIASSESMTHAVIYETLPEVNAVVHVHCERLWNELINKSPTTSPDVAYGTPQMAHEIKELTRSDNLSNDNLLIMAGHQDGLVSFGANLEEAATKFLSLLEL